MRGPEISYQGQGESCGLCRPIGSRRGLPRRSLKRVALGFCLWLFFLLKLEDARVGLIGHFGKQQQVVATEALRGDLYL